jgi:hypothetical protein
MLVTSIVCRAHKAAGLALDRLYIHARVALSGAGGGWGPGYAAARTPTLRSVVRRPEDVPT